ncbi:FHA domain-containing protein [Vulcanisaeta distributa]|uniref:FHA domain containing protein n=1 Tax=Vulcanisaeta distributa (strain DSM 14429 / JCM 11212 / NBRC 100878 / IC-017) TaxID=572478 RepID=E1QUP7_VULDI|nr:FHA domain-containing protein [Vulcanisaeta distributa]ADN51166.1 FHA domain containing protein [Vulcanisaeta distributa DSM 14429]
MEHSEETRRMELPNTETVRRGPSKLELTFIESPKDFMKDFKVIFDLSIIREITLGRSPENMVIIPDPTVSRKHAVITMVGNELLIKDLNSTNGTYVLDGGTFKRVSEYRFNGDVVVRLGYYTVIKLSLMTEENA